MIKTIATIFTLFIIGVVNTYAQTYIKPVGVSSADQGANSIIINQNGEYVIGGYVNDSSFIALLDNNGLPIWSKSFDFSSNPDYIMELSLTSDNFIIGCGISKLASGGQPNGFVFKVDMLGNLIWSKLINIGGNTVYAYGLNEAANGNYNIVGGYSTPKQIAYILELEPLFGNTVWDSIYAQTSFSNNLDELFYSITESPTNQAKYIAGRMQVAPGNIGYRPSLSRVDQNGNIEWTKTYMYDNLSSDRLYGNDVLADGDSLTLLFSGKVGGSSTPFHPGLLKTDTSGNISWAKYYTSGGLDLRCYSMVQTPMGYVLSGYINNGTQDLFMIYTDKQGNVNWANSYGDMNIENSYLAPENSKVIIDNNFIVTVGRTNSFNTNYDALIVKVNLSDGLINGINCVDSLSITTNTAPSLDFDYSMITGTFPLSITTPSPNSNNLPFQNIGVLVENTTDTLIGGDTIYLCLGEVFTAEVFNASVASYNWSTGGTAQTETFTSAGSFWVDVSGSNGCIVWTDTFYVVVDSLNIALGNDTTLCSQNNLLLDATNTNATYLWQDGSTNPTFSATQTGTYFVEVANTTCIIYDTINITFGVQPIVDLGSDTVLCGNINMSLDAGPNLANSVYLWQDGSTASTFNVTQVGTYWVTHNNGGCQAVDSINISNVLTSFDLGNDTTLCNGDSIVLSVGVQSGTILWQDNSTNQDLTVNTTGMYSVTVTTNGCSVSDSVFIQFVVPPTVNLGNDTILCEGTLQLNANNPTLPTLWNDGSTNQNLTVTQTGLYWVEISNGGCIVSDSINVTIIQNSLGNIADALLCNGVSYPINISSSNGTVNWNDGSTAKIRNISSPGVYWVDLNDNGCIFSDTFSLDWQIITAHASSNVLKGCSPLEVQFIDSSTVNFGAITNWDWNLGAGVFASAQNPIHTFYTNGTYYQTLTVTSNLGCTDTYQGANAVEVFEKINAFFTHSPTTTSIDKPVFFNNLTVNPTTWSWNFGDGFTSVEYNTEHTYATPGVYTITLTAENENGCEDKYTVSLLVENEILLYVPNIFTPTTNGVNQLWFVELIGDDKYQFNLKIFNRWGEIIWESFDQSVGWDGKYNGEFVQDGAYVWRVDFGEVGSDKKYTYTGHVSVLK